MARIADANTYKADVDVKINDAATVAQIKGTLLSQAPLTTPPKVLPTMLGYQTWRLLMARAPLMPTLQGKR